MKIQRLKFILFVTYAILILFFLFSYFYYDLNHYIDIEFLQKNKDTIFSFRNENLLMLSIFFFVFVIIWILLQGFGSPLVIIAGFFFGTFLGSILLILSHAIGCTLVYIIANSFFKENINQDYSNYYVKLKKKFSENEFKYFTLFRIAPGIPLQLLNILPVLFNMKLKNFFLATIVGSIFTKTIYINFVSSISDNLQKETFIFEMFYSKEILFSLLLVIILYIIIYFIKKRI